MVGVLLVVIIVVVALSSPYIWDSLGVGELSVEHEPYYNEPLDLCPADLCDKMMAMFPSKGKCVGELIAILEAQAQWTQQRKVLSDRAVIMQMKREEEVRKQYLKALGNKTEDVSMKGCHVTGTPSGQATKIQQ